MIDSLRNVLKPLNEQQQILENNINDWIGNSEQNDDITVVGIKI